MSKTIFKPLYKFRLIDVFRVFHHYKKLILGTTFLGLIISIIVALVLPVYYQSKTLLYPVSMTMADRSIIFGQQQSQSEFSYFGNKYDANRILQVANSNEVYDYIINKYNLTEHYKFPKDEKYLRTKVQKEFLENYHAFKNDKDAIEISLLDTDSKLCAEMLNDISGRIDQIASKPVEESKNQVIEMLRKELTKKTEELKSEHLEEFQRVNIKTQISNLSETLTQYETSANENVNSITVLEKAYPAEKKSKPVRWMIVLFGTLTTLLFICLGTLGYTQYRYIQEKM